MKIKREKFIKYLREQANYIEELADAFEEGENDPQQILLINLDKLIQYDNGLVEVED